MTKQEAYAKISVLTAEAKAKVKEAEKIADDHGVDFSFNVSYGMGGTYKGQSPVRRAALAKLSPEEREALGVAEDTDDFGWQSSSSQC